VREPEVKGTEGRGPAALPPRPPGGKALLRLLDYLQSRGYDEIADAAIRAAVGEESRGLFLERAVRFRGAPGAGPPAELLASGDERAANAGAAQAKDVALAYRTASSQLRGPSATEPQWRSLGPWTVPKGQTYGASKVNVSGRMACVVVDPSDPAHVLAGAAHGGVWESRDRGASWQPRTDRATTLTVGALAFDPSHPLTVYCGTGEGEAWSMFGDGILRSTDGGATWAVLCTAPFDGDGFFDLVVDPANGNHLLAATTAGLYESANGGVAWTRRRTRRTWSVSMAPGGGPTAEVLAGCSDGLFRSTDGGATWSAVTLPSGQTSYRRLVTAIAPSDPTIAYVWASGPPYVLDPRDPTGKAKTSTSYLWRRAAGTWTLEAQRAAGAGDPPGCETGQDWYDWFLAVAPDNPAQVYVASFEVHRGDLAGSTWTWTNLSNKGSSGDSIHPDSHCIAFEPGQPNTIYVGNDGGLYRSPDRGITWQHCNNGLVISEFEYLAQDCGSSRWLIGGTQDNGTERWTGFQTWDHAQDGDGGDCGVQRDNPWTVFHTFYGMSPERATSRGDYGSWTWLPPPVPDGEGSLFYPPFECSISGGETIAIGGDAFYVSRDNGANWTRLTYPAPATASAMYIPDTDHVYIGTTGGGVLQTSWDGSNWSAITALTTPSANRWVSDIYVDPNERSRMWVTYSDANGGRVYRSLDGGATWTDRSSNLPAGPPITAIEVDPLNRSRLWVSADMGVYESRDGGRSWTDFSNGLPHMAVGDLLFQPHARVLRAGTRNRGAWEIPVDGWQTEPECSVHRTASLNANETNRCGTGRFPTTWHVVWTVMPTTPHAGAAQLSWTVQVEKLDAETVTYWLTIRNLTADPVEFEVRCGVLSLY
jgi:photosystem II stability/assembly factor-like uncharacterized protein